MPESEFLIAALAYAERGWRVFPCRPGGKEPIISGGVNKATCSTSSIEAWWGNTPKANIALACGPESGVYCVDIDLDESKGVDGWESLKEFPPMPDTVSQQSPRGGGHFFFKTNRPPRNMNSFRNGIDIRSAGFYVILSPSVHPNGKTYEWVDGHAPGEIEFAEFPEWLRPEEKKRVSPWDLQKLDIPAIDRNTLIERASSYLSECSPAVQGQGGHSALMWAASAMAVGFDLDDSTALNLLWHEYNPRCIPPWDSTNNKDREDFERKVSEARKKPIKPRGWLLAEFESSNNAAIEYGAKLSTALLKKAEPVAVPEVVVKKTQESVASPGDWPSFLLEPSGYVGDLAKWMNATAVCQQPKLSVVSAIVAAGALFGGKIKDRSNQRTNIYAMGVAPSSAGKDHPFKCISELFEMAGAGHIIGGGSVTSDSAVELALTTNPVKMFAIDEAGDFLTGIKQAGQSSGSAHLGTIKPCFKILWSSANRVYKGKQKAEQELRQIHEPHVSLWCLTTPNRFYQGIGSADLEDGFIPRMLVALSDVRNPYRDIDYTPPPVDLVNVTSLWFNRQVIGDGDGGDILTASRKHQLVIEAQPGAKRVFTEFARECEKALSDGDKSGENTAPLWGKGLENAKRIALILAAGDRFDNTEIMEYHAFYACALVRQTIVDLIASIGKHMADTSWEMEKKRILAMISDCAEEGMARSDLARRTQWIRDRRTRDNYLADLVESGLIHIGEKKTKTRPSQWVWAVPYGLGSET